MSKFLSQQLQDLQQRVAAMANLVQQSLGASVAALLDADADAARIVCEGDQAVNERRFSLEADAVALIATQQPVARDVRLLIGVLEIATELERMGDYAKDIARITLRQAAHGEPTPPVGMVEMADRVLSMLDRAMQAFTDGDAQLATSVAKDDDAIDELCGMLHRNLLESAHDNDQGLEEAVRLLPAVHNIERFADRVTNICERIIYVATGDQLELDDRREPE